VMRIRNVVMRWKRDYGRSIELTIGYNCDIVE
jgi:hypothetical protein